MDVDPPVHTWVRHAVTAEDKKRFQMKGRCFYCDQQGHMARDCAKKKCQQSSSQYRQSPSSLGKPTTFAGMPRFRGQQQKPARQSQGFRKYNKPRKPYTSRIHTATIEEIDKEQEEEQENKVISLMARTTCLSEGQRKQWVKEMNTMGINF
jgi:hypothetical protein